MKHLRQYIRKLILESSNPKILKGVEEMKSRGLRLNFWAPEGRAPGQIAVYLYKPYKPHPVLDPTYEEIGYVRTRSSYRYHGECLDAYEITGTNVHPTLKGLGIGALMYDVAVEIASMHDQPIMCDRTQVSTDALRVWNYMMNNPNEYEVLQLDNAIDPFVTPDDPEDDCVADSLRKHLDRTGSYTQAQWLASSITKAYKKKALSTIDLLKREGIFISDEELGF
tara:strand:- start:497 stop:1168 length:672 start_codon:yes stop_codon:yes gene_type:complete